MGSSGALSGLLGGAGRVGTGAASEPEIGRVEDSYGCLVVCFSGLPGGHGDQGAAELGSAGHRAWAAISGRRWGMASTSLGESAGRVRNRLLRAPLQVGGVAVGAVRAGNRCRAVHIRRVALPRSRPECAMSAVRGRAVFRLQFRQSSCLVRRHCSM